MNHRFRVQRHAREHKPWSVAPIACDVPKHWIGTLAHFETHAQAMEHVSQLIKARR